MATSETTTIDMASGQESRPRAGRRSNVRRADILRLVRKLVTMEGESLRLYRPLPAVVPFHESMATWRVLDGSNRSSKTLSAAVESVRAWLGCDPHDKYIKRNGKSLVVGLDGDHIAMMWQKCAEPGPFSLIRDEQTRQWRSVRTDPNNPLVLDPYDTAYCEKWKDAPPLIPPRMIAGRVAWEDRAKGIPRFVRFTTGWNAHWRSSMGKPPQGQHLNHGWFDEHIENGEFYSETVRGLVPLAHEARQHWPRAIWSATPQTSNYQLIDLRETADAGSDNVHAFKLLIEHNPFVPDDAKRAFFDSLAEDERQVRYFGVAAVAGKRLYPRWDPMGMHGCVPGKLPPTGARYVVLDPGRQHCGTLFVLVDSEEEHVWVYDGFDLRHGDAAAWAGEVKKRQRDTRFEAFVIDQQMGKQHPPGSGLNVAQQYFAALEEAGVQPRSQGPLGGFFPGTNDVPAREEALLGWLEPRGSGPFSGTAKLQVLRGCLPELEKQVRRAHMSLRNPKKREELQEDLLVCLEYIAAFDPRYRVPVPVEQPEVTRTVLERLHTKLRRKQNRHKPR